MKKEILISVIVPIYNVEPFLRDCIDSLLNQNADNYEIVLVDDGSPDNCPKICDEYAKQYSNIKVVHKENGGLVSARKAGVMAAIGKYIANVDSDDWVDSNFINTITEIIDTYNPDAVHFDCINLCENNSEEVHINFNPGYYDEDMIRSQIHTLLIEDEFGRYFDPAICSNVFRAEAYKDSQLKVNDSIKIGEDASCTKPIFSKIKSLYICDKCLYFYRINSLSMTKGKKSFELNYPLLVGKTIESNIEANCDFSNQIYRFVTHNLFNACSSAFYSDEPYGVIKGKIKKALKDEYYQNAIKNCKYNKRYLKGLLVLFALKYKIYFLMKLYCKYGNKAW